MQTRSTYRKQLDKYNNHVEKMETRARTRLISRICNDMDTRPITRGLLKKTHMTMEELIAVKALSDMAQNA